MISAGESEFDKGGGEFCFGEEFVYVVGSEDAAVGLVQVF